MCSSFWVGNITYVHTVLPLMFFWRIAFQLDFLVCVCFFLSPSGQIRNNLYQATEQIYTGSECLWGVSLWDLFSALAGWNDCIDSTNLHREFTGQVGHAVPPTYPGVSAQFSHHCQLHQACDLDWHPLVLVDWLVNMFLVLQIRFYNEKNTL